MSTINIDSQDQTSKQYYPSNSSTHFTIRLPVTLLQGLSKRWTIQMKSLSIPRMDYNVYPEFGFIKVKIVDKTSGYNIQYTINIPTKNYKSLNFFKKSINAAILSVTNNKKLKFGLNLQESDKSRLTVFNKYPNKVVSLGFDFILSYMLGCNAKVCSISNVVNTMDRSTI